MFYKIKYISLFLFLWACQESFSLLPEEIKTYGELTDWLCEHESIEKTRNATKVRIYRDPCNINGCILRIEIQLDYEQQTWLYKGTPLTEESLRKIALLHYRNFGRSPDMRKVPRKWYFV
ncbi:hypothetical protein [Persicobacter sp. CCB-QB2]|uniref:hypothetical protein n=1 Tax=Persicobacter sp. CCB-QB2 TaxID=1561025 RepID=UPI0006A9BC52|nr:hypothetical protein [Persicobacter sp. CCB-QB2]